MDKQLVDRNPSAVQRAAGDLRAMALAREEGEHLGSEEELMTLLRISRPTLRQAAALVSQDQLIRIRRGVNGGYFATMPTSMSVARMAAIYLRSRDSDLRDIVRAISPIRTELARLAARNRDGEAVRMIEDFLEGERRLGDGEVDYRAFLRAERAFGRVLGAASGNEVLSLFLAIVYDLSALIGPDEDVYIHRPERVESYRMLRNRMAQAILEGDEELAVIATRRCSAVVAEWMEEDVADRGFMSPEIDGFD